jgi:hypothetical protein
MTSWRATQAKAQFSAVLDKAETEGPQIVQRRKKRFIVLTEEELTRRTAGVMPTTEGKTSGQMLWEALRPTPDDSADYEFPRVNWTPRKVEL